MVAGAQVGLSFLLGGHQGEGAPPTGGNGRPVLSWPRIAGVARPGETLTVEAPALTGIQSYQWIVDEAEVSGATGASFVAPMMGHVSCRIEASQGVFTTPIAQVVHAHNGMEDHAMMEDAALAIAGHVAASHIAIQRGAWSDPEIWDVGTVPSDGAVVLVPIGVNVTYDVASSPRLDRVRLDGALRAALDQSSQMLVETVVIAHSGLLEIGGAFASRLPGKFDFDLIISDRAYALCPSVPSNLDLVADPFLLGRGIVCLGNFVVFGDERKRHIKTANGAAPKVGDTSLTLAQEPTDWSIEDEIIIPGTALEVVNGAANIFDERRVITGVSGSVVSFDAPLIYNHDHHNAAVTRTDLQPSIANMTTNVTVRSESAAAQRRGHIMIMYDGFSDVWDLGVVDMGRTDTTGEPGNILVGGQFQYFDGGTDQIETIPTPAEPNSRGRYPFHFHFCGFNRSEVPNIHNSVIDGAPGWGLVHHGCEAEIFDTIVTRFEGSGMVAEGGNETGPWVRNFVFGCATLTDARYDTIKLIDGANRGRRGDFGRHGVAYYFRGRAVRTVDNVAASCVAAYVFFHREFPAPLPNLSYITLLNRDAIDVKDLRGVNAAAERGEKLYPVDYPIAHFTRNEAFGCFHGFNVTKVGPDQGHDIMTQLKDFRAWAIVTGMDMEYVGNYIVLGGDFVATDFDGTDYAFWKLQAGYGIWFRQNTVQMTVSLATVEAFRHGVGADGSQNVNINASNDNFSQDDPRFIIDRIVYINCTDDLTLTQNDPIGGATDPADYQTVDTVDVTRVFTTASPPTIVTEPSITLPFIVADWSGRRENVTAPTTYNNVQSGFKADSIGSLSPIPKTWDKMMITAVNNWSNALDEYLIRYGYWTFGSDKILVTHQYHSDRLTARPIRVAQAYRITETDAPITNGKTLNGEWPAATTDKPECPDLTASVKAEQSVVIDVVSNATSPSGGTLTLAQVLEGPVFFAPASGRAVLDASAGTVTYTPDRGFVGADEMFVWVSDGTGHYVTVKVEIKTI